jgi:hypothetical protein
MPDSQAPQRAEQAARVKVMGTDFPAERERRSI